MIRIIAAMMLFAVFLWSDVALRGKGVVPSALELLLPVAMMLISMKIYPRLKPLRRNIFLLLGFLLCIAANLSQLFFAQEWVESLAFGVTLGFIVGLALTLNMQKMVRRNKEMRPNGLESSGAPPTAGTPETHPNVRQKEIQL